MAADKNVNLLLISVITIWRKSFFLRFLLVGGINTLFSYAIYALGLFVGLNYQLANLLAMLLGILFSFKTQGKIVFNNVNQALFWRYLLFWILLYRLNILFIAMLMDDGFNAYQAGALSLLPITLMSFFIQKILVFKLN